MRQIYKPDITAVDVLCRCEIEPELSLLSLWTDAVRGTDQELHHRVTIQHAAGDGTRIRASLLSILC